jgi:general secretion pathway protein H
MRGFTLIEILVVVVILAVVAGALTLATGGVGGQRQLAHEAEQARALFGYACEQAERSGRDIGISLDTRGYRFSIAEKTQWVPSQADELRPRVWLDSTDARLSRDGQALQIAADAPDKPQLVCFSSGELTPFRLELGLADLPQHYRLDGEADGEIKLAAIDQRRR